ncbi:MAG: DUF2914 domain-containing protein [Myxococcota bacterium]
MKGLALAMMLLSTPGAGCDRQAAPADRGPSNALSATGGTAERGGSQSPVGAPTPVSASERQRLKDELRKEIEGELRAELTRELRPKIRAEVERELAGRTAAAEGPSTAPATAAPTGPATSPPNAPTAAPTAAGDRPDASDGSHTPTDTAGTPTGPSGPRDGDPWTTLGAKIWPSPGGFRLVDVEVGTGLEEKAPTDVRTVYDTVPELLYCYTVFENPGPEATVTHVWRRGTRLVSRVELEVGSSPKWKTWSKQRTQSHWTGTWSCEVLGPDGEQLGLTVFRVGSSTP